MEAALVEQYDLNWLRGMRHTPPMDPPSLTHGPDNGMRSLAAGHGTALPTREQYPFALLHLLGHLTRVDAAAQVLLLVVLLLILLALRLLPS